MVTKTADYWIKHLGLEAHPEGGYFKNTYRSALAIEGSALPEQFGGARPISSAIYFLLKGGQFSAFHRIKSDELWHFYTGIPMYLHTIDANGSLSTHVLGTDLEASQTFQALVPAGCWMAATPVTDNSADYTLFGCTVAPGFDFEDLTIAKAANLLEIFPQHQALIEKLSLK